MPGIQSYPAIPCKTSYPLPKSSMTAIYYLALFFCILTVSAASPEEQIPMQDMQKTPPPTPELKTLKQFLEDGQIIPFYEAADNILQQTNRYRDKTSTDQELREGLLLCYLIASAPFIDLAQNDNVEWLSTHHDIDHKVKDSIAKCIPFRALVEKTTPHSNPQEALHQYLSYTAIIINQLHKELNLDFEATRQKEEKTATANLKLMNDEQASLHFYNRLNTQEARNNALKAIIRNQESGFIKELLQCFPTKAVQVKKYLRMAGYDDKEIPALLDRTIGRVPAAAYLYKACRRSRGRIF